MPVTRSSTKRCARQGTPYNFEVLTPRKRRPKACDAGATNSQILTGPPALPAVLHTSPTSNGSAQPNPNPPPQSPGFSSTSLPTSPPYGHAQARRFANVTPCKSHATTNDTGRGNTQPVRPRPFKHADFRTPEPQTSIPQHKIPRKAVAVPLPESHHTRQDNSKSTLAERKAGMAEARARGLNGNWSMESVAGSIKQLEELPDNTTVHMKAPHLRRENRIVIENAKRLLGEANWEWYMLEERAETNRILKLREEGMNEERRERLARLAPRPRGMGGEQPRGMGGEQPRGMGGEQPRGMGGEQPRRMRAEDPPTAKKMQHRQPQQEANTAHSAHQQAQARQKREEHLKGQRAAEEVARQQRLREDEIQRVRHEELAAIRKRNAEPKAARKVATENEDEERTKRAWETECRLKRNIDEQRHAEGVQREAMEAGRAREREELRRKREVKERQNEQRKARDRARQEAEEKEREELKRKSVEAEREREVIVRRYAHYDHLWTVLKSPTERASILDGSVSGDYLPWPILITLTTFDQICYNNIKEFLFNPFRPGTEGRTRADVVKREMLRWHGDKFITVVLPKVQEQQRGPVRQCAEEVSKILGTIFGEEKATGA